MEQKAQNFEIIERIKKLQSELDEIKSQLELNDSLENEMAEWENEGEEELVQWEKENLENE